MGRQFVIRWLDNTGGVNLRAMELRTNQSEQQTEWVYLQNVETYQEGGFAGQKGNEILNPARIDETKILGIGAYQKADDTWWIIYQKASGKAYVLPLDGGAETEIKTGLNATAIPQFVQFNGRAVVVNGEDTPWTWDGTTAADVTNPHPTWSTGQPSTIANIDGGRLVAAAGSTIYYCDQGNQNEWRTGISGIAAGIVVDPYADAADIIALASYGSRVSAHTTNNRIYLLTGNSVDTYAITPIASNQAAKGKHGVCNVNGYQYLYTGTGIIVITTTELNQVKLGDGVDIARKIQPFITGEALIYATIPASQSEHQSVILLPINSKNALMAWFKTKGSSIYDAAAIYDFNTNSWTFRRSTAVSAAAEVSGHIITGTTNGLLLKEFSGTTLASQTMQRKIVSAWVTAGVPDIRKDHKRTIIYVRASASASIEVSYRIDFKQAIEKTVVASTSSTQATYGTAEYNNALYAGEYIQEIVIDENVSGKAIQIEINSQDESQAFKILGITTVFEMAGSTL